MANYDGLYNYAGGPQGEYRDETTPVGHFGITNRFGLYDMHGNVLEWCLDHWHESYTNAPVNGSAWIDRDQEEDTRLLRGGAQTYEPRFCRSAYRHFSAAENQHYNFGFRISLSAVRTV